MVHCLLSRDTPLAEIAIACGRVAYANNNVTRSSVGTISKGRGGWEDGALGYYKEGKKTGFTMNYDFFLLFNKKLSDFSVDGLLGGSLYYTKTKIWKLPRRMACLFPVFIR